jgi:glutamate-1-semialdehyde 2,1-aminomutase
VFFADDEVHNYDDAQAADGERYAQFFRELLARGVFLAPSPFETMFPSLAHTDADIDHTIELMAEAAAVMK